MSLLAHRIGLLGSGSDFAPFVTKSGVTCADLRYSYDPGLGISSYPLYHSVYETFHLVDEIMDPHYKVNASRVRVMRQVRRHLMQQCQHAWHGKNQGLTIQSVTLH